MNEGVGHIIDIHEPSARGTCAPNHDFTAAFDLCLVCFKYERRHAVARTRIEVVVRPVEICRHRRDEVAPIFGKLDAFSCRRSWLPHTTDLLAPSGQKGILAYRLFGEARVDT